MATDLTISLVNRPGTLAQASDALGRAGVNIEGACGFAVDDLGVYHVLVEDAELARRALIDAGFDILAESRVAMTHVENRPGAAARLLRQVADAGVNVSLLYTTVDGRLVLVGDDAAAIQRALG
jgi:hypothetical protein